MKPNFIFRAGRAKVLPVLLILLLLCAPGCAEDAVTVCILDSGCSDCDQGRSFVGPPDDLTDEPGHGTAICSLVRAGAPEADVVMLKCFEAQTGMNDDAVVAALYAAVDEYHADVINMSWTLNSESEALKQAVDHARSSGAVLVACTGNLSLTTGLGAAAYPAAWDGVIGVAGVDLNEGGEPRTSLWYLYGEAVDFCARGDCGEEKGSSYAAARVSGMIADALHNGTEPAEIGQYLQNLAQDMGDPGHDRRFGWGYLAEN